MNIFDGCVVCGCRCHGGCADLVLEVALAEDLAREQGCRWRSGCWCDDGNPDFGRPFSAVDEDCEDDLLYDCEQAVAVGDRVRILGVAGDGAWRGAVATVQRVYSADGRPNLEPVATVQSAQLGLATFAIRHLAHLTAAEQAAQEEMEGAARRTVDRLLRSLARSA